MNQRSVIAAALISAALVVFPADASHAEGNRACVSRGEFNHAQPGTRAQLEREWGVRGHGTAMERTDPLPIGFHENWAPGLVLIKYRFCPYGPKNGAVYVYYDRHFEHNDMTWWLMSHWRKGQSGFEYGPVF